MICPIIGLLLIAVAAWLFVSGMKLRALATNPFPACSKCGHLLHGGTLRCNECGSQWSQEHIDRLQVARQRSWKTRLTISAVLVIVIISFAIAALLPLFAYGSRPPQPGTVPL